MKNILKIVKIIIPAVMILSQMTFFIPKTSAQQACTITGTTFRTTKAGGPNFYQEDDRPFVYIDVNTQSCIGQSLSFSLYRSQTVINPITLSPEEAQFNINALDERQIIVGNNTGNSSEFTIAMRAGEENCLALQDPDCIYHLKIDLTSSGDTIYTANNTFAYDCDANFLSGQIGCDNGADWDYEQIIPLGNDLGGTNGIDPHGPGNTAGNTVDTAPPATGDDPNAPSVIHLELENPLAGSVDSLQDFIQKFVNIIIKFSIPLIAIVIVWAGFQFVSARGESGKIEKAKTTFTYAIIGGLILLAAWLVADAIKDILLNWS